MDTLSKDALKAALTQEQKGQLLDLGRQFEQMRAKSEAASHVPASELEQLKEIVSHNAVLTTKLTDELSQNLVITNLVLQELLKVLDVDEDKIVTAARAAYEQLMREDDADSHPVEATVFGG